MLPLDELETALLRLQDALTKETPRDPESLLEELEFVKGWLPRMAEMVADAEYHWNIKRGQVALKYEHVTATILRELIAAEAAPEQRVYRLAERTNAGMTHYQEAVTSQLSYEKQLLERQMHQRTP